METVLGMTDLQIKLFTALGQLSVAGIVGYIAWQQWRTARKKLKADLFDKRFAAYRELTSAIEAVCDIPFDKPDLLVPDDELGLNSVSQIKRLGLEAAWLFDKATSTYISQTMVPQAAQVSAHRLEGASKSVPRIRRHHRVKAREEGRVLQGQLNDLALSISPYLELQH